MILRSLPSHPAVRVGDYSYKSPPLAFYVGCGLELTSSDLCGQNYNWLGYLPTPVGRGFWKIKNLPQTQVAVS